MGQGGIINFGRKSSEIAYTEDDVVCVACEEGTVGFICGLYICCGSCCFEGGGRGVCGGLS